MISLKSIQESAHLVSPDQVLKELDSSRSGLTHGEAGIRLELFGQNRSPDSSGQTVFSKWLGFLKNPITFPLIAASLFSVTRVQQKNVSGTTKVLRGGDVQPIPSAELVPGDLVLIAPGDSILADLRVVESDALKVDQSVLTDDPLPIEKRMATLVTEVPTPGDRSNMVFSGSLVVNGRALCVVISTGSDTALSQKNRVKISRPGTLFFIDPTWVSHFRRWGLGVAALGFLLFMWTLLREGFPGFPSALLLFVQFMVAAIPEGIPAVLAILLAVEVRRIALQKAHICDLTVLESLSSLSVLCTDKTKTLAKDRMAVEQVWNNRQGLPANAPVGTENLDLLAEAISFCNDAFIHMDENGFRVYMGDPTEIALKTYAESIGYSITDRLHAAPRISEFPFDPERKQMSTFHVKNHQYIQYTKGAPEVLLNACNRILIGHQVEPLDPSERESLRSAQHEMASKALYVLAAAMNVLQALPETPEEAERDLVFIGFVGLRIPLLPEAKRGVAACLRAGIEPIILTGDHLATTVAHATELGILRNEKKALSGTELDRLSDEQLQASIAEYSVFARLSPPQKIRIVQTWQSTGRKVAFIGNEVKDAPVLKTADVGAELREDNTRPPSKNSPLFLTGDPFSPMLAAIEASKRLSANLQKSFRYLLTAPLSQVLSLSVASILGFPMLYIPQLLFINLLSDMFPAIALGIEPSEPDPSDSPLRLSDLVWPGIPLAFLALASYFVGSRFSPLVASTYTFCVLSFARLFHALHLQSSAKSFLKTDWRKKPFTIGAILISMVLTAVLVTVPGLNDFFHLTQLNGLHWFEVLLFSAVMIPLEELTAYFRRKRGDSPADTRSS